ncbi:MAG: universal stress protein [Acidobacteriota bacterium]|nr:universal stress protein [Acidobacteriota bacterium]
MTGAAIGDRAQPTAPRGQAPSGPVLLAYDGSRDAAAAIATAGRLLGPRQAVVITAWAPAASWVPYDPVTVLAAPVERLLAHAAGIDDSLRDIAQDTLARGVKIARAAGFDAKGRLERGRPSQVICDAAEDLGADPIVVGARGAGRIESALLGSVSASVVVHAKRPVLVVPRHPVV